MGKRRTSILVAHDDWTEVKGKGKDPAPQQDEDYDSLTASKERQIDEIICHEEGVLLCNKKVVKDNMV